MADTITTNLSMTEPEVGASSDTWGTKLNANFGILDALWAGIGATPFGTAATKAVAVFLQGANNLSDVADPAASRANLGAEPAGALLGVNSQSGSYTLVLADAGKVVEMNATSALQLAVPPDTSVAFPVNTRVDLVQLNTGQLMVVAGAGVTLRSFGGKTKLTGQYSGASLYKRGANDWVLIGDLTS
jgi:hypothetical protein